MIIWAYQGGVDEHAENWTYEEDHREEERRGHEDRE